MGGCRHARVAPPGFSVAVRHDATGGWVNRDGRAGVGVFPGRTSRKCAAGFADAHSMENLFASHAVRERAAGLGAVRTTDDYADVRYDDGTLDVRVESTTVGRREAPSIVAQVTPALERAAARGSRGLRRVVLDLSSVSMMSGMGLGLCVEIQKRASGLGAELVVVGLNSHLRDLFRVMRIDRLCTMVVSRRALEQGR